MQKRRRQFTLLNEEFDALARGVLYDEGNVQILWREDIGDCGEQYASVALVLDLVPGIVYLKMVDS